MGRVIESEANATLGGILIANRGEIAVRIARAAADSGIRSVSIYSSDDRTSLHTSIADEAILIPGAGPRAYLDIDEIIHAAKESGCNAIHPGYGFLSENSEFAEQCESCNIIFIGPRSETIRYYGPKSAWFSAFDGGDYRWLIEDGKGGRNKDARTLFFYIATVNTPAMVLEMIGVGSQYALAATDLKGRYLEGSENYKLNIPADVPAKDFWSAIVYNMETKNFNRGVDRVGASTKDLEKMLKNEDGSVDIYYAPNLDEVPKGFEANWVTTESATSANDWFFLFRLYRPTSKDWFKTWMLEDVENISQ